MEPWTTFPLELTVTKTIFGHKMILYRDAARLGEWHEDEVRELYQRGLLDLSDYYWREGMKEWQTLRTLLRPTINIRRNIFTAFI
jgi:hypothetical protein